MKLLSLLTVLGATLLFAACSGGPNKKVVVMSSGKIQVDPQDPKTINFTPGTQHNEQELTFSGSDKVTITVKSSDGTKTYDLPDQGLYLLNLKNDTLLGNLVNFGQSGMPASISTEQLEHIIDSTKQFISGQNASDEKKTYFVIPGSVKKLSVNTSGSVLNPYKAIPYTVEVDKDGKAPEIYKFFTVAQKRESLDEMIKRMTK
ncbi:MAG: hypothetical protein QM731_18405 [Chitinophagaceae bacterium]